MQNQLHVVRSAAAVSGGEGLAALRYAESISSAGCSVTFLSSSEINQRPECRGEEGGFDARTAPSSSNFLQEMLLQCCYIRRLFRQKQFDLIHLHGMWSPLLAITAFVARIHKLPVVISPHGCLAPWALGYKRYKKWLALKLYQGMILRTTSLFVATAQQEADDIRRLGLRQEIAVIPNGVDVGPPVNRHENDKEVRIILFLSRIHPIKGLLDLVNAWSEVRHAGWRLIIAGGDEENHRATVEALIREKDLAGDFEFMGFVEGVKKQALFDIADIFVLPTYSENFGLVIAEALANEIPVVTTHGAPWQDLEQYSCGWWVAPGVAGVAAGLAAAMRLDPAEIRKMGRRGRILITEKYSWDSIGIEALKVSQWMLDHSTPRPATIDSRA